MVGKTLGHYKILEPLGKGGMGEVYRARDTKLDRDVAIKVLPEDFATDPDRLARFEREAKLLAALNHPNIITIHGLEEEEGAFFLVLELVKGESLKQRLSTGPLSIEKALDVCKQIAEALEAAHNEGIIHRDLKPANVLITPDGRAKVLDFGIAKSMTVGDDVIADTAKATDLTVIGILIGTPAYMSPEQVRGEEFDKRADIWAFGCVIYEALTGSSAFGRKTLPETLAAILEQDPDWSALPQDAPDQLRRLIRRCLRKDPRRRLRDIGDAWIVLGEVLADGEPGTSTAVRAGVTAPSAAPATASHSAVPWVLSAALFVVAIALGWLVFSRPQVEPSVARLHIAESPNIDESRFAPMVAISPDGERIAFVGEGSEGQRVLHLRQLDDRETQILAGTDGAYGPFFSPDGEWLGYFDQDDGMLKKIPVRGGAPIDITYANFASRGGSWGPDDLIVFTRGYTSGLFVVPAAGGQPQPLTTLDAGRGDKSHRLPEFLPSGDVVLFTVGRAGLNSFDAADIAAVFLDTGEVKTVLEGAGATPRYSATGHLLFARDGKLMAVPFDPVRVVVTGPPIEVLDDVVTSLESGPAAFALSRNGTLVYVAGGPEVYAREIVHVDHGGRVEPLPIEASTYNAVDVSPGGTRLALSIGRANDDVWVHDLERGTTTRVTREGDNESPLWTRDGSGIAVSRIANQQFEIRLIPAADGPGKQLVPGQGIPSSWSPDGDLLYQQPSGTLIDIHVLPPNGGEPWVFLQTPFAEHTPKVSPDGRSIAYVSDESGRDEVYVQAFPDGGARELISIDGGTNPHWAPDGRALFFRDDETMMVIDVSGELDFGRPRQLFELPGLTSRFDVAADGQGFVVILDRPDVRPDHINVILNWFEELKERVPTGR
ncbi:MAG: protein kinase [Gemmatimonadetes bacterium]|nr:protein kinase [Gemmatimonadota bacterium]